MSNLGDKNKDLSQEELEKETCEEEINEAPEEASEEPSEGDKKDKKKNKSDKKVEELKEKIKDLEDRNIRQIAEFQNFRNRTEKEKSQMFDMGAKNVIEKILPVVDNFERGLASIPEDEK
ncbi:MAG: nucleotide exchange factor GrpE, partial [Lachnospiraceae bacterium]|nr:nucleotide exchange factor GrpE [Lachnospiraceae bacterium]